jgi:acyl-coenzyme A synthetase/AMP-(fatty) acid ligase
MPQLNRRSLRDVTLAAGGARWIADRQNRIVLGRLRHESGLAVPAGDLRGRSVLIRSERQLPTVLAAIELDGIARRILLCPPDLAPEHLPAIARDGAVDVVVTDGSLPPVELGRHADVVMCGSDLTDASRAEPDRSTPTEWVLFTSGTTGRPKMIVHTLASLTGPLDDGLAVASDAVWSTFYDVRRYGGLQILLRALIGGASMVLSDAAEPVRAFLSRAGASGVTHISGTPSHWRRVLMSAAASLMAPAYVRLSGEVADQAILDHLHGAYPSADIAHAFASTEAGVAFDVRDGLAGFPASLLAAADAKAEMRVEDGTLRIRSSRMAVHGLAGETRDPRPAGETRDLRDDSGFIDTGDMVELRGERYYFIGRREGVINVGGQKIYPEEVEAVINLHPAVQVSRVRARSNPITGAVVAADVVLRADVAGDAAAFATIREAILATCRASLAAYKVPVSISQVASLAIAASGKLVRVGA